MGEEKLLTVRDVASLLAVSEKEVLDLAESGAIPAYKIGGVYVRFKREQVLDYKKSRVLLGQKVDVKKEYPFKDRLADFLYFNDFYILASLIVVLLLVLIIQGY